MTHLTDLTGTYICYVQPNARQTCTWFTSLNQPRPYWSNSATRFYKFNDWKTRKYKEEAFLVLLCDLIWLPNFVRGNRSLLSWNFLLESNKTRLFTFGSINSVRAWTDFSEEILMLNWAMYNWPDWWELCDDALEEFRVTMSGGFQRRCLYVCSHVYYCCKSGLYLISSCKTDKYSPPGGTQFSFSLKISTY